MATPSGPIDTAEVFHEEAIRYAEGTWVVKEQEPPQPDAPEGIRWQIQTEVSGGHADFDFEPVVGGFEPVLFEGALLPWRLTVTIKGTKRGGEGKKDELKLPALLPDPWLLDREASREAFLNNAPYYRVLHLATHACADETESARSRIFFADDYLYAHELYTLDLHADMAVLSACETGVGEFRKGEGVISLARGFAYAGIPSTVMSLWSVNDRATSDLMQLFYRNLKAGMPKDRALQSAKLEFLSTREDKASLLPAYWAAFVHFGDVDPLPIGGSRIPNWTWALLLIPILAAGWFFRRRVSRA